MTVDVELYSSIEDVPAEAWDAAVAASGAPLFYSREYLLAYEKSTLHSAAEHLYIVASRNGGQADHAVLPVVRPSDSDALGVIAQAFPEVDPDAPALISPGWHCYDGEIPATSPDAQLVRATVDTLLEIARDRSVAWCALVNVDVDSPLRGHLPEWGLVGRPVDERYAMDLRAHDGFESYLSTLSHKARQNLRRHGRRAEESGLAATCVPPADADLDEVLDLVRLLAARHGIADFYRPGPFQDFVRRLDRSGLVFELRLDDTMIAAGICQTDQTRFHQWTFGVDYAATTAFSPYTMLFTETIRAALASGAPVLEGGRRNGWFKARHGLTRRQLYTYLVPAGGGKA